MQPDQIQTTNWQEKLLRTAMLSIALLAFGISLFVFAIGPMINIAVAVVSAFVAIILCRYQIKFERHRLRFSPSDIFVLWGTIALGVPGGVVLATAASFAANSGNDTGRNRRLEAISNDTAGALLAGAVYFASLGLIRGAGLAGSLSIGYLSSEVIAATVLMAAVYAVQKSIRFYLASVLGRPESKERYIVRSILESTIGVLLVLVTVAALEHFGIEFGLVIAAAAALADAAYRIHLHRLAQKTREIREASRIHLATVEALATAIDARDQVGVGHARRTQIYAVGIGKLLGLSESEINALRTGSLLHDIGKLAVPDHILNKPGRLTYTEMEKTKTHSSVGAAILEKVGFPYPVVPTVRYHHERWDGNGYPEGLMGNKIPLTARILSVADAYDALRGARAYRPAVPRDEACRFLKSRAGTQYDPQIVELLLRNLQHFEAEIVAQGVTYDLDEVTGRGVFTEESNDPARPTYVDEIKRANHEAFTLFSLAKDFSSALSKDETLSLFTAKIGEFAPFDTCAVYLLDERREFATAAYVEGRNSDLLKGRTIKPGDGASGRVLSERRPIEDLSPTMDFAALPELGLEYSAMVSVPLIADDELIGAVSLYSTLLPAYQDEHLRLLETISRIGASAIRKSLRHAETESFALTDPMTGLPNARSLHLQFEKEVKRADRKGGTFQLLVLDLDGFKAVNDNYGHKTGDRMLREVSAVIRGQLRDYDVLARYGGDEFVAIIPDADPSHVRDLSKRIETAVNGFALEISDGIFAKVGISTGAAGYPNNGHSFDQIIVSADKAMYRNKASHKRRARSGEPDDALIEPSIDPEAVFATDDAGEYDVIVELDESHILTTTEESSVVGPPETEAIVSKLIN